MECVCYPKCPKRWLKEQKPLKHTLPRARRGPPCNTAMPRPTSRTTPNCSSNGWGTVSHVRHKVAIGYNGAPKFAPKSTSPHAPIANICLIPGPTRPDLWWQTTSGSDSPFFHNALNRQSDGQTERPIVHGKVWWLQAATLREWRGLTILT